MSDEDQNPAQGAPEADLLQKLERAQKVIAGLAFQLPEWNCNVCGLAYRPSPAASAGMEHGFCPRCERGMPAEFRHNNDRGQLWQMGNPFVDWLKAVISHQTAQALAALQPPMQPETPPWGEGPSVAKVPPPAGVRTRPAQLGPEVFVVAQAFCVSPQEVLGWSKELLAEAVRFIKAENARMRRRSGP